MHSFRPRFSIALSVLCAISVAGAQVPDITQTVPINEFAIKYFLTGSGPWGGNKKGEYEINQKNGRLLIRSSGDLKPFWFLFDGERSYLQYDEKAVLCQKGLATGLLTLPLYLPYNTPVWQQFFPVSSYKAYINRLIKAPSTRPALQRLAEAAISSNEPNVAILNYGGQDDGVFLAAKYSSSRESARLEIGVPGRPVAKVYDYSHFHALGAGSIPGLVTITLATGGGDSHASVGHTVIAGKLDTFSASCRAIPTIKSLLVPGTLVSYQEVNTPKAGVIYDPQAGTLARQIAEQVSYRKHPAPASSESGLEPSRSLPLVPLVCSAVFALISVVFLILRARRN